MGRGDPSVRPFALLFLLVSPLVYRERRKPFSNSAISILSHPLFLLVSHTIFPLFLSLTFRRCVVFLYVSSSPFTPFRSLFLSCSLEMHRYFLLYFPTIFLSSFFLFAFPISIVYPFPILSLPFFFHRVS